MAEHVAGDVWNVIGEGWPVGGGGVLRGIGMGIEKKGERGEG